MTREEESEGEFALEFEGFGEEPADESELASSSGLDLYLAISLRSRK